ncbi:polyprenyl synthetase family protein [Streptomyces sp. NPDC006326]|uniref:polyprenyl synthetase family protein n=1 Tax=Streptomyces sp. NPDC006326 TaxID=3156752 RepID=UPI0033BA952F
MKCLTYLDVNEEFAHRIEKEIRAALARLDSLPSHAPATAKAPGATESAVTKLLHHQTMRHPLAVLPMLVHATETGRPEPALPLSAVHLLWWTSACYLDDLADGHRAAASPGFGQSEGLLASLISGTVLPIRIVQSLPVPEAVRLRLTAEIATGWAVGTEGQLRDLTGIADHATRDTVVTAYRGKSGGPYAMVTAMAAILSGAAEESVEQWREFGFLFGILWQLFNDQEDILTGRNEDLANGTVTYLLSCALEQAATPRRREQLLGRCAAARHSRRARSELARLLLAPDVLRRFGADLGTFRASAHRLLDELGGDDTYRQALHHLVDHAAQLLLHPDLAPAPLAVPASA